MRRARAAAHPNVALSKYWGKDAAGAPAVPSLSVTLGGLATRTEVTFDDAFADDTLELDGAPASELALARASALLDRVRAASGLRARARVVSANDFPTASGLASSASGFAALALAASAAAGLACDPASVAALAETASRSAARSLHGGWVELPAGGGPAIPFAPAAHLPVVVLACVTSEGPKAIGSSAGMSATAARSPFYRAWLEEAPRLHARLRDAVRARDLPEVGALAEASALAMHATALAAGVAYLRDASHAVIARARTLRDEGLGAWATMDAGPQVKVLVAATDLAAARAELARVPGVLRVLTAPPGGAARAELEGDVDVDGASAPRAGSPEGFVRKACAGETATFARGG